MVLEFEWLLAIPSSSESGGKQLLLVSSQLCRCPEQATKKIQGVRLPRWTGRSALSNNHARSVRAPVIQIIAHVFDERATVIDQSVIDWDSPRVRRIVSLRPLQQL